MKTLDQMFTRLGYLRAADVLQRMGKYQTAKVLREKAKTKEAT